MWLTALHLLLAGTAIAVTLMLILWLVYRRLDNASYVDPGWAYNLALIALAYAILGPGLPQRKWLVAGMAILWGGRLGTHLLLRIIGQPEEGRYQQLRKEWGDNIALKFLGFFQLQALLDVFLSLPFLFAALNPNPQLQLAEYAAVILWAVSLIGEAVADAQLSAFKRDPSSHGQVCQRGLWNYSRHPNYFFEWFVWIAWALFALASPYGWIALVCPIAMWYFLFRVTGIPATEAQSLRSKGEAYRRYQQTTSSFVPWFKKVA